MEFNNKFNYNNRDKKNQKSYCCERVIREVCYYPNYLNENWDRDCEENDCDKYYDRYNERDGYNPYDRCEDKHDFDYNRCDDKKENRHDCNRDCFFKGFCCRIDRKDDCHNNDYDNNKHDNKCCCKQKRCCGSIGLFRR